jgi:hypothetical protein
MDTATIAPESASARRHMRQCLEHARDWVANGNQAYSPLVCLSLLLAIGLTLEIGF